LFYSSLQDRTMDRYDWTLTIKLNLSILKLSGLWPRDRYKMVPYTTLTALFLLTVFIPNLLSQIIKVFFILDDLTTLAATILSSFDRNPLRREDVFSHEKHDNSEGSDETPRHRHVPAQEHRTGSFGPAEFRLLENNLQFVYDVVCRCNRVFVHFSSPGQIKKREESPVTFLVSVQHPNLTCLRTHVHLPSHRICLHLHESRQHGQLHCSFERLHRMPV
jgi:hypothetical protein